MSKRITLETYDKVKATAYDTIKFSVPFEWLEKITVDEYNMTVDEFLHEYTWDDSERIGDKAQEQNVYTLES